jgi:fatty-acyl-CoA synthase
MDYIRENYGSTEGAILVQATGDDAPRGAVGEIADPTIKILGGDGRECAPARVDAQGAVVNYDEAVGEICKDSDEYGWFQGYFDDEEASKEKVRDGVYHSGDLGHVRVVNGKRYLYFDGRTGDWIRKDGENFSALQVSQLLLNHPSILVAASYGVPCAVANDLVMAALKLPPGESFGDLDLYTYCENLTDGGGMSRVWIPDFVRIVDDFPYTQSMKIVTRTLRAEHFNPSAVSGDPLFWREHGDKDFKPLTAEDYDALRERFVQAERLGILEPRHEVLS